MKIRLLTRIIIGYVIFGILVFITVAVFTSNYNSQYLQNRFASQLRKEASLLADNYASGNYSSKLTLQEFQNHLSSVSIYTGADIYVIRQDGKILVSSKDAPLSENQDTLSDFDIIDFSNGYYTVGDFYHTYKEDALMVYSPVTKHYNVNSYVFMCASLSTVSETQSDLLNGAYLTFLILFLLSLIVLVIFILTVHIPMKRLVKAASHYNQNDYEYPLEIHQSDELGFTAATFHYMTHELSTLEEDQRKFVSNVSHDFRSPLTSIKGYAQAMADGTIPPELQEKYLNVIIFEAERLEKLTQELLDLNKYGSKGYFLDISSFDLNECIRMTVESFEQTSKEKQISFRLVLTGDTLFVMADMARIQQVLHNLIDNAIKFSHHDSTIAIETTVKNDKVFVSVKDTGIGIPRDSIGKIWDRFYKTDLSRGKDKKGTGLGLAIVKEIINAHHENINVVSTENVGTEFIFSLPLSGDRINN